MARMIESLTHADFALWLGQRFTIALSDGGALPLTLIEVTPWGEPAALGANSPRHAFSLLFRNERRDAFLPQRTYRLEHPAAGPLELFLVPLGTDPDGMRYEAIIT